MLDGTTTVLRETSERTLPERSANRENVDRRQRNAGRTAGSRTCTNRPTTAPCAPTEPSGESTTATSETPIDRNAPLITTNGARHR
jgi:hypothetical protein